MELKNQKWWPSTWTAIGGGVPSAGEISQGGTFITPRMTSAGLTLAVEYKGRQCTTIIPVTANEADFFRSLSKTLESYRGKPFREVETLDI